MRRLLSIFTITLVAAGCTGDTTGPTDDVALAAELELLASFAYGATSVGEPGDRFMERLSHLPAELALSAEQAAQINGLFAAFLTATATDRDALAAIMEDAKAAHAAGATRDEIHAILAGGAESRTRLRDAERALRAAVMAVLTPAQRAALAGRTPPTPGPCSTLTDAQRNEISALRAGFETTFETDIATVRSVRARAVAAHEAGASREEVHAILVEARAAMHRLRAGHIALREAVQAVLTPEQRAAGCLR